ncbi:MAG TPA: SDR family NAD(P)-dependent oxidoreductase [Rhizomicrobium sp.]|nr:SDR family NAD(P)-dependent oxidoreductase [Rhizomicrobium sp.]
MRRALITGGGSGIGLAIAKRLSETCDVTVLGRGKARLDATGFKTIVADVADPALKIDGAFDIVVNNAGIVRSAPFHKLTETDWAGMLNINVMGTVHVTRAVLPVMRERNWGRIVNIASTAALKGYAYVSAYVASKHALLGLTRALALELVATGVTVNAVCPGYTDTDIVREAVANIAAKTKRSEDEARAELASTNPQRRLIAPAEVAAAVAYLVSDEAAAVTGQAIAIDGGETA